MNAYLLFLHLAGAVTLLLWAVLQSSTAVAILAAGFAGSGTITLVTGLALMLGADFGSSQDLPRLKQAMFLTAASDSQQGLRRDLGPLAGVEAPIPC